MIVLEPSIYPKPIAQERKLSFKRVLLIVFPLLIIMGIVIGKSILANNQDELNTFRAVANNPNQLQDNRENEIQPQVQGESFTTILEHTDGLTSVLLVGVDSRNVKLENGVFVNTRPENQSGTRNTDTIMQVVYNHKDKNVTMISIPRDMGVDVEIDCLKFHGSIHWVYDKAETKKCPQGGIEVLKTTVASVTGIPVHYHVFVTLEAFNEIVEIVGEEHNGKTGLWIDNPKAFYEIYPYNDHGWESLYFPKGRHFMDAERAIRFVRSRQFTQDWGRAERQQIFIQAVKDRVLSSGTLLNPTKILNLFGVFRERIVFSQLSFGEIVELIQLLPQLGNDKISNVILSPELAGKEALINKQPHNRPGGPYYMVPTDWRICLENPFCKVHDYISGVINYPRVYSEQPEIGVISTSKDSAGKPSFSSEKYLEIVDSKFPIILKEETKTASILTEDEVTILDFTNGDKPYTLASLQKITGNRAVNGSTSGFANTGNYDIILVVNP